jgi:hypothetical protein
MPGGQQTGWPGGRMTGFTGLLVCRVAGLPASHFGDYQYFSYTQHFFPWL